MGNDGHVSSIMFGTLTADFAAFAGELDRIAVLRGWFRSQSGRAVRGWRAVAAAEFLLGVAVVGWISSAVGMLLDTRPIGLAAAGLGLCLAGILTYAISGSMPSRTSEGARLAGWLAAYRRTLQASIAQATSIEHLVEMRPLPWVGTPGEEIAWAVAFGLDRQIDGLLSHSLETGEAGGWPMGISDWFSIL
jgi:hypothetical protein